MKKLIILSLIGIGAYLILSKRKVYAEEVTPKAIAPSIELEVVSFEQLTALERKITSLEQIIQEAKAVASPEIICKTVIFTAIPPITMLLAAIMVPRVAVETICGYDLETIREKAKERAITIFEPLKATFLIAN